MGTEMAVPFANISIVEIKTRIIQQSKTEPRKWKRYIDNVFSLWDWDRKEIHQFIKRTNYFHCTIKFTAEISENQITFLDATVFKGERFAKDSIWISEPSASRPRPSNLRTSSPATHQA